MKASQGKIMVSALVLALATNAFAQNNLQFTGVNATPEKAIQLHWASNTNELYQIQYADSLIDTNTGNTTWNVNLCANIRDKVGREDVGYRHQYGRNRETSMV